MFLSHDDLFWQKDELEDERLFSMDPWPSDVQFQPASVDLVLGGHVGDVIILEPGEFMLAHTREAVTLSEYVCGMVMGKSSWGRMGLQIQNAGWVDPGFSGQLTLELANQGRRTLKLEVGDFICQIAIAKLASPARLAYGDARLNSHYQGQMGSTLSWMDR